MRGLPQSTPMASQDSTPPVNFFSDPIQLGTVASAPRRPPRDPASAPRRLPQDPDDFPSLPASSLMHEHDLSRAHMASHGSPPVDPGTMGQSYYASILFHGNGSALDEILSWPEREQQTVPVETTPSSSKPSNKRSKNSCEEEDKMLVSAWLNISLDAAQGINQPRDTYWNRIHSFFHEHKEFESDRNASSLQNRWGDIQNAVNKFASCVRDVERRNQSGVRERQDC